MTRRTLTGMGKGGSRSRRVKRVAGIATLSGMTLAAGCSSGGSEPVEVTQQGACASITYEAENIVHSTGGPTAGGWNIWTNGYIGTSHSFVGGMTIVTVNASGTVAAGQWPHLVLSVGGVVIGSATVDTTSFAPYVFQASIPAGVKELRVAFDNDYLANGQDRNLLVDRLTIACAGPTGMGGSGGNAGASGGPSGGAGAAGNSAGGSGGNAGNAGTSGAGSAGVSGETVSGSAALKYQTDWGSGYCADVTVSNTSAISATTWTLGINLNQAKMSSAWNGQFSANSGAVSVTPADFNRALAPGASASFGFCANATGSNYRPTLGKLSLIANNGGGTGGGGGGNAGNDNQGGGGNAGNDNQGGGGTGGAGSAGAGSAGGGFGGAGSEGGASGSNGAGAGGTAAGGGAGGYTPSTGGYAIKSSFLNNPNLAVAHALSTADFYAKAADPQFGGFFTYLDRQGRATGSNKSFVVEP